VDFTGPRGRKQGEGEQKRPLNILGGPGKRAEFSCGVEIVAHLY
jgi:hypothetical protein